MLIYNTLSRAKEEFKEIEKGKVVMYVCGLTPYDSAHIGHARTVVAFDVLKRFLMFKGYNVFHIQNITDVDDKILKRAEERGLHPLALADIYHTEAFVLFDKLNVIRADVYPRVSQHIQDIIDMVSKIMENGYAYETESGVYFEVDKFKDYGKLSGQTKEELKKHRIEPDPTKKKPYDFALWKKTTTDKLRWKSPWGEGRPGWHIECSAMSLKYAGRTLDIHGGAKDLIFPHHENEIAQSEAATGKPFAKYWIHTGFLTVDGVKMSKSLGNFITLRDALNKYNENALRLFFISTKYSSPLDYSEKAVKSAEESIKRLYRAYLSLDHQDGKRDISKEIEESWNGFIDALENDLDTPNALASLFSLVAEINKGVLSKKSAEKAKERLDDMLYILGIRKPEKKELKDREKLLVGLLIEVRRKLREKKEYELADEIRAKLKAMGIALKDVGESTSYEVEE